MDQSQQLRYLQRLGIQPWVPRDWRPEAADVAPAPQTVPTPAPPGQETVPDQSGEQVHKAPVDISRLDWQALTIQAGHCTACRLHQGRTQVVFGVGNRDADLMVIGEGPGADEDRQGEPFVGRAGQLLNEMLWAIAQPRERVYIANIVKCRPPENRNPQHDEALQCAGWLHRQIELVAPKVILALGKVAAQNLLQTEMAIGKLRGGSYRYAALGIPVVVTYHPAYLLRSPQEKRKTWQDLLNLKGLLGGS